MQNKRFYQEARQINSTGHREDESLFWAETKNDHNHAEEGHEFNVWMIKLFSYILLAELSGLH